METVYLIEDDIGTMKDTLGYVLYVPAQYVFIETFIVNDVKYYLYRPKGIKKNKNFRQKLNSFVKTLF